MNNLVQNLKPMKLRARKNWLWLWILPTALSWLLVSLATPTGGAAFWVELAIIGSCSCLGGFALAFKNFSTLKQRILGGLFFTGGSLCLVLSVVFMGCHLETPPSGAEIRYDRRKTERQEQERVAKQIVPRDAQADQTMLDLTSFYNELLPGKSDGKKAAARALEPGTHKWDGIKFDARGMAVAQFRPDGRIAGIRVGQKCSEIAFVHGSYEWFFQDERFSRMVIHFANRHTETIPLVFGKDVDRAFWNGGLAGVPLDSVWSNSVAHSVIWAEGSFGDDTSSPGLKLFIKKWKNPFPGEMVTSIDVVPASRYANPFLVAITLIPVNP
jgi:hypothetical protein